MPKYIITYTGLTTERKRTRRITAINESTARATIEADGITIDQITEIPPEPPSQRQINYARSLGVAFPDGVTAQDASALISLAEDNDTPSSEQYRGFARSYCLEVSNYIGQAGLFDAIHHHLSQARHGRDLIAWFAFCVNQGATKKQLNPSIQSPADSLIIKIANSLADDRQVFSSICKYEGRSLLRFGEHTTKDGYIITGGSKKTIAYLRISALLKNNAPDSQQPLAPKPRPEAKDATFDITPTNESRQRTEPRKYTQIIAVLAVLAIIVILSS